MYEPRLRVSLQGRRGEITEAVTECDGPDGERITLRWATVKGRSECVSVDVQAAPGRGITVSRLRAIASAIERGRRTLAEMTVEPDLPRFARDALGDFSAGPRRGRRVSQGELEAVADTYREAWARPGESVTDAVAKRFHLSRSAASKRIMAARAAGLLDGVGPR